MRENARWKQSASYRGRRVIDGKPYVLYISGTRREMTSLAGKLKKKGQIESFRIMKALYYPDYELWIRATPQWKLFRGKEESRSK